jgi:hypothetical protein
MQRLAQRGKYQVPRRRMAEEALAERLRLWSTRTQVNVASWVNEEGRIAGIALEMSKVFGPIALPARVTAPVGTPTFLPTPQLHADLPVTPRPVTDHSLLQFLPLHRHRHAALLRTSAPISHRQEIHDVPARRASRTVACDLSSCK